MYIYLVQHAQAKQEEEDPSRGLTEKGISDIKRVASRLAGMNVKVANIYHSGKKRATQTARILHESIGASAGMSEADCLLPQDTPEIWADRLASITTDIIIVGHLPHIGKLISLLLSGNKAPQIVNVQMASVTCLKKSDDGHWAVNWMITPDTC